MKKFNFYVLLCSLFSAPLWAESSSSAANSDCPAAVDAADSMNINRQGCDYSQEGLNGVLHRVFKKNEEGARLDTAAAPGQASPMAADVSMQLTLRLADIGQAASGKNQLLAKAMLACPQGFQLQRETYRPQGERGVELSLDIRCL